MNEAPDGYKLLSRLRGLEQQLRQLRRRWRSFRATPSSEALSDLARHSHRFADGVDTLARSLEAMETRAPVSVPGPAHSATARPAPREVVTASRDLDAKVWEATHRWKSVVDGEQTASLKGIISVLESSADRSATLIVALGGSAAATVLKPVISETGPARKASVEGLASELEAMLWRLQADWHQVRRAPNPDRLRLLRGSFQAAAEVATRLNGLRSSVGESYFRRSLKVGRRLADGVRFLPYRDPFTGVYNREGFEALAGAELKRCRRYGRPFGLLILQVSPPDLGGLQRAVATARAELREYDLIARYVDDLVLIGVPEGGPGATRRVASRVLKALRAGDMGTWFQRLAYSTLPEDGSTLGGLLREARARLQA